jgi:hypothetical protein
MVLLHGLRLEGRDTSPLARFDSYSAHLDYLHTLVQSCKHPTAVAAYQAVRGLFYEAPPPVLPVALLHLDWHFGNILLQPRTPRPPPPAKAATPAASADQDAVVADQDAVVVAVIDWEFAGVADPRLDVATLLLDRWQGDVQVRDGGCDQETQELWDEYAQLRFGGGSRGGGSSGGEGSSDRGRACGGGGSGRGTAECEELGGWRPWVALSCMNVMVLTAAVCAQEPANRMCCDLVERSEDFYTAAAILRLLGFELPPPPPGL